MSYWPEKTDFYSTPDEKLVYEHLLYWVQVETPEQVIDRFRTLFLNGFGYSDAEVQAALDRITALPSAQTSFKLFFNRCCYIIINRWQSRLQFQDAVPEFLDLLKTPLGVPSAALSRSMPVKRLRFLVKSFVESELYQKMRRLSEFMVEDVQDARSSKQAARPLVTLIRRYPYLYSHCLLTDDSSEAQKQSIRLAQDRTQKQFEVDLSKYFTGQLRQPRASRPLIQPVKNPTLLTDSQLHQAMTHFVGKVDRGQTYRDSAHYFAAHTAQQPSFQHFKQDLYDYLTSGSDLQFGQGRFHQQLHKCLESISAPNANRGGLNDFLMVRTYSQILNFIVVDSVQKPEHYVFMDLLNNVGTPATVGLLLKVVLACKRVKPYLEKRLAILFNHYENHSRGSVQWLISCLEHLNLAWSTHFGGLDFSFVKQIL